MNKIRIDGYHFPIDLNNLVTEELIRSIFGRFRKGIIKKLNFIVTEIKFLVGGNQWHGNEDGFIRFEYAEYNVKNGKVYIFLHKIFNRAIKSWDRIWCGSLKREIWVAFVFNFIQQFVHISQINPDAMNLFRDHNWSFHIGNRFHFHTVRGHKKDPFCKPLMSDKEILDACELITNPYEVPFNLGFFGILYEKYLNKLKRDMNKLSQGFKIKVINELRRWKMDYKYEISLSSFIRSHLFNLVAQLDFATHYKDDTYEGEDTNKIYWKLYPKCKRGITELIEKNSLYRKEMNVYTDSADREHIFITYFLKDYLDSRMKDICYDRVGKEFSSFKDAITFAEKFDTCPCCGRENHLSYLISFYLDGRKKGMREHLLDAIEKGNDKDINIGVLCCSCFDKFSFESP